MFDLFKDLMQTVQIINNRGIYHFDLKPDNILTNGTDFMIIDFGSAQIMDNKLDTTKQIIANFTPLFSSIRFDTVGD